ncbi:MAG: flagellar hook capping protein [Clostridia bacterium]|nr:flagellar hook capping protein [Clostridia bacterium]
MNVVSLESNSNITTNVKKESAGTLTSDEFLNVLITQLKNQNPLEPMNDVEYITQVVQFSMLDGINSLNQEFYESKALDYIGKNVMGTVNVNENETQMVSGQVRSVSYVNNKVLLNMDGASIYLENVMDVSE